MSHDPRFTIQLFDGSPFDFSNITPESFNINHIAHGCALRCRFDCQCLELYSVAEHQLRASFLVDSKFALETLLHDSGEFVGGGDRAKPFKNFCEHIYQMTDLPGFVNPVQYVEDQIFRCVESKYNLDFDLAKPYYKKVDMIMLATEQRDLMPGNLDFEWITIRGIEPLPERIVPMDWRTAKSRFLIRFHELASQRGLNV